MTLFCNGIRVSMAQKMRIAVVWRCSTALDNTGCAVVSRLRNKLWLSYTAKQASYLEVSEFAEVHMTAKRTVVSTTRNAGSLLATDHVKTIGH